MKNYEVVFDTKTLEELIEKTLRTLLQESKKEELFDTSEIIKSFNTDDIDPEIWETATTLFTKKYDIKLFNALLDSHYLPKDKLEQLKNGIKAFNECVVDAANARINYLTDKYVKKSSAATC